MAGWISTGVGPFGVGTRIGGGKQRELRSPFARGAIGIWGLLVIITFLTVPVVSAFLIVGLIPLFIACMIAEVTHKTPEQKAERAKNKAATRDPALALSQVGQPAWYEAQAANLRAQHLAGRKITHRARTVIKNRPDLEYVIYPERKPVDPFQFFSESDRAWYARMAGDTPEAQ